MNFSGLLRRTAVCTSALLLAGTAAFAAAPEKPLAFYAAGYLIKPAPESAYGVKFAWKPAMSGDNATGYRIYVGGLNNNDFSLFAEVSGTSVYEYYNENPAIPTAGHQYAFYVTAYNADGESAGSDAAIVDFTEPSAPPQQDAIFFTTMWQHKLPAGTYFKHDVDAVSNTYAGAVEYSLESAPDGMTIDAQTGVVLWESAPAEGEYTFVVRAAIAENGAVHEALQKNIIYVYDPGVPSNPVLFFTVPYAELKLPAGQNFEYRAEATTKESGTISYSLLEAPNGMTIDAETGVIQWAEAPAGYYKFAVRAELSGETTGEALLSVMLHVVGEQPNTEGLHFVSEPPASAVVGEEYVYTPVLEWEGAGEVSFEIDYLPEGAVIDAANTLRWTPVEESMQKFVINAVLSINGMPIGKAQQAWAVEVETEASGVIAGVREELPASAVTAYPNPAVNTLSVRLDGLAVQPTIALYDLAGTRVLTASANGDVAEVDVRAVPQGMYYLHITSGNKHRVVPVRISR